MARKPAAKSTPSSGPGPGAGRARGPSADWRVALLVGPELFLHAEHTEALRRALAGVHGRVGVFSFDGATAEPAAVLDECRTFGLMEPHKLVIVDNADQFLKERGQRGDGEDEDEGDGELRRPGTLTRRALVERYVAAPCDGATLLLRSEKGFTVGRLGPLIEKVGAIVKCDGVSTAEAAAWAVRRASEAHEATLAPDAATLLVDRLGPDLSRLDSELAKLALNAVGGRGPGTITARAVAELVGLSREEEVWVIQVALLSGDAGEALRSVRAALDVSRHHPVLISWACVDLARKLHGASRGLAAGMNQWQMAKSLKLWGSSADLIVGAARRLRPADAAALLRDAIESDVRQKSGLSEPERALEVLALRFAGV